MGKYLKLYLKTTSLTKRYKQQIIFQNINLYLTNDKIHFIIGDNGSGKTTLLRCFLGLTSYKGSITWNVVTYAYAPANMILPEYLTMYEFLWLLGEVRNITPQELTTRLERYLQQFTCAIYRDQVISKLSQGTKQKIILIQCLMTDAEGYFFDEPLQALDIATQYQFISEIKRLKTFKKLIVIATHQLAKYRLRNRNVIYLERSGR